VNEYTSVHETADRETARKWREHEPLTMAQVSMIGELIGMVGVNRTTETTALINIVTDATAHPQYTRERDPYGRVNVYKPTRPALRVVVGERCCSRCGGWKERDEFNRDSSRADGLDPYCRDCRSHINAEQYARRRAA